LKHLLGNDEVFFLLKTFEKNGELSKI